jgi:hypothetical protein
MIPELNDLVPVSFRTLLAPPSGNRRFPLLMLHQRLNKHAAAGVQDILAGLLLQLGYLIRDVPFDKR